MKKIIAYPRYWLVVLGIIIVLIGLQFYKLWGKISGRNVDKKLADWGFVLNEMNSYFYPKK